MAEPHITYTRLPGRGVGSFGAIATTRHTLWLGPDHVLAVRNNGYTEDYKRFYFKDIQSILACKNSSGTAWTVILAGPTVFCLTLFIAAAALGWSAGALIGWAIPSCIFGVPLLIHLARGTTCTCYLRTAVQTERLYSLSRFRRAMTVINLLRPHIEAAQGSLSEADLARATQLAANPAAQPVPAAPPTPAAPAPPPVLKPYTSRVHAGVFTLLLIDLVYTLVVFLANTPALALLGIGLNILLVILAITAAIVQHNTDLPRALKGLTGSILGYLVVSGLAWSIYSSVFMLAHPDLSGNMWQYINAISATPALDTPGRAVLLGFCALLSGAFGGIGLLWLSRFRRAPAREQPPVLPVQTQPSHGPASSGEPGAPQEDRP
ncbi:MAG: hypothetical protein JXR37_09080 [Kiritimatiellae bacterium]|nr:hypothetical protein [Kiritimatiellia bacterium]